MKLLDHRNQAYVELIKIFVFIIFSAYSLPNFEKLEQYNLELSNYGSLKEISQEKFIQAAAWFDE